MPQVRFAILLLLLPISVMASIAGSSVELELPLDGQAGIGRLELFRFKVTNASTDLNWIANAHFVFPDCCTVAIMRFDDSEAQNDWAFEYVGIGTNEASYLDADGGNGEIMGFGDFGWFDVTVRVGEDCPSGIDAVIWRLEGDLWGAPPHVITDTILIDIVPVAESSWSTVKALY